MPVNVNQYQAAIGVFNNCSFITTKKCFYVMETNSVKKKMYLPCLAINMVVLFLFLLFMLAVSSHQKYKKSKFKSIVLPF